MRLAVGGSRPRHHPPPQERNNSALVGAPAFRLSGHPPLRLGDGGCFVLELLASLKAQLLRVAGAAEPRPSGTKLVSGSAQQRKRAGLGGFSGWVHILSRSRTMISKKTAFGTTSACAHRFQRKPESVCEMCVLPHAFGRAGSGELLPVALPLADRPRPAAPSSPAGALEVLALFFVFFVFSRASSASKSCNAPPTNPAGPSP